MEEAREPLSPSPDGLLNRTVAQLPGPSPPRYAEEEEEEVCNRILVYIQLYFDRRGIPGRHSSPRL